MTKYGIMKLADSEIYVELPSDADPESDTLRGGSLTKISFKTIVEEAKNVAQEVFDTFQSSSVEEIEMEYGIKLDAKAGVSFWAIAEIGSSANFTIKLKWRNPQTHTKP